METLKVSTKSNANSVAGAIAAVMEGGNDVELSAIGAGAVNQAIKAVAIARGYVAPHGINLACVPGFQDVEIEGEQRTGMKMIVVTY
ncbi:MAG: stage sporulation protein [Firmicutes bacterium]|nr:stage sporulation protein [Bacillota bacterium]